MIKELIISIIIILLIFIGNSFTENYTKYSVEETSTDLLELRSELMKNDEEIDMGSIKQKLNDTHERWHMKYEKLAYYIEHDELEKIETELSGLKGYIDKEEYSDAIPELDKSIYILEHIKDKSAFNLKNIF